MWKNLQVPKQQLLILSLNYAEDVVVSCLGRIQASVEFPFCYAVNVKFLQVFLTVFYCADAGGDEVLGEPARNCSWSSTRSSR